MADCRAPSASSSASRPPTSAPRSVVERDTPVVARIDGGDQIGYVVAHRATRMAIDKAKFSGLAAVAAHNTWYTGMLSYYAEMAAAEGLVSMIASNASPWVAPHGATEGRFGTNPICFGFPSAGEPVIWDIGTSAIIHAEVTLHRRLGTPLPEGVAFDASGNPTRDPAAALAGAFAPWGGHKGSGLAIVVHLLGMLAGSPVIPPELERFGFLILAIDPAVAYGGRPVEGGRCRLRRRGARREARSRRLACPHAVRSLARRAPAAPRRRRDRCGDCRLRRASRSRRKTAGEIGRGEPRQHVGGR